MNILVLTSVYKDGSLGADDHSTDVVNSFVHDWVKQGHDVKVIHNSHRYPKIIHQLPAQVKSRLATRINFYISDYKAICEKHYEDCGAEVWRLPMLKIIPHKAHGKKVISDQVKKITAVLEERDFNPDVIVGHWASPQMEIISALKTIYNCKTAVVLHGTGYIDRKDFPAKEYLSRIDRLGCRSKTQAEMTKQILGLEKLPFVCYSGVPDAYLDKFNLNVEKYKNIKVWKFAYVGRLVGYKRVDVVIRALSSLDVNWEFTIVGDGAERNNLEKLSAELRCSDRVRFCGRIPRDQVMEILKETHCFVMVSKGEIFGLVYLEAMAATCIAIGSKWEGIDGVINDNENGFLCEPADADRLREKIATLVNMDSKQIKKLAWESYRTATMYSGSKVAEDYLKAIT